MDKEQLLKMYAALKNNPGEIVKAAARHRLINFARYMQPDLALEPFHVVYYTLLDKFAHGEIKKMIVQMPPQHGKSQYNTFGKSVRQMENETINWLIFKIPGF